MNENLLSPFRAVSHYFIFGLLVSWLIAIQFKSSTYQITTFLILIGSILTLSRNLPLLFKNKTLILAVLLPIVLFASTLDNVNTISPQELITIAKFILRGGLLIIGIYLLCLHANISSKFFIDAFIVVLFLCLLLQLAIWLNNGMPSGRINGFINNGNQLAPFAVTLSLLSLGGILSRQFTGIKLWKIFLSFSFVLSLVVTYYTYSRIAYLSLFIGLAYLSITHFKIKYSLLLLLVSLFSAFLAYEYDSNFRDKFDRSLNITTSDGRTTQIWPHVFNKATEKSLIFGNGFGKTAEKKLKTSRFYREVGQFPYHSVPLELIYISGITGLIAFYWLMIASIKKLKSYLKHAEASAFVGVLISGLAEHSIFNSKPYISLIVIFVVVTLLSITENKLKVLHANHPA